MPEEVLALARWLSWLEHCPAPRRVVGSIPGPGTYLGCRVDSQSGRMREAASLHFCLTSMFLSLPLPLFLKAVNVFWGED